MDYEDKARDVARHFVCVNSFLGRVQNYYGADDWDAVAQVRIALEQAYEEGFEAGKRAAAAEG